MAILQQFRANGKLLISGEYFVLDGALALALPTRLGQTLVLTKGESPGIEWESRDADGQVWFRSHFRLPDWYPIASTDAAASQTLQKIGQTILDLQPNWLKETGAVKIVTQLEFPRHWGLGSSSTLLALLSKASGADPYALLEASFGGSGYDLACATAQGPLLFQRNAGAPHFVQIPFYPDFHQQLYFVYLGKKQDSREGIARYRTLAREDRNTLEAISKLSWGMAIATDLTHFCTLLEAHESLIANALQLPRAKELYFKDFQGSIKSLGAWGGDFVLAATALPPEAVTTYFQEKGFEVCLPYEDLI
jgi:mevalonate kinase